MRRGSVFIVSLSRVDALTLLSLLLAVLGLKASLEGSLSLGIGLMLWAMLVDMLDGALARHWQLATDFGRNLDSLCDVLTYLLLPLFLLHQMGLDDPFSLLAQFVFLACGIIRLARFNTVGTLRVDGLDYHVGLQVFWSQLVVVLSFPLLVALGDPARVLVVAALLILSFLMVADLRVRKPTAYWRLAVVIVGVAGIFFWLHLSGRYAP